MDAAPDAPSVIGILIRDGLLLEAARAVAHALPKREAGALRRRKLGLGRRGVVAAVPESPPEKVEVEEDVIMDDDNAGGE